MARSSENADINRSPTRSSAGSVRPRATRKRATRQKSERESPERVPPEKVTASPKARSASTAERKAPTNIAANRTAVRNKRKQWVVVSVLFIIGIAASAAVGVTDSGQIDVQEAIKARNERIKNNQASENDVITSKIEAPVQNTSARKADGGLRGLTPEEVAKQAPKPAPVTSSSTATTSDATASSSVEAASSTVDMVESAASSTDSI